LTCSLRLPESVERLNSSLAQSVGHLWVCKLFKNCKKTGTRGLKGAAGICSKKSNLLTSTIESSRFAVKAFCFHGFAMIGELAHICKPIHVTGPHKGDKQANQSS